MPGKTKEERVNFVKWSLHNNEHVKEIKEVFKRGNTWIEVNFDCEYGRDEAVRRISKKDSDWFKLIPEQDKTYKRTNRASTRDNSRNKKSNTFEQYKRNNKEEEKLSENEICQATVWDLPADISWQEVNYLCKNLGKSKDIHIKRSRFKALAIIELENERDKKLPWVVPLENGRLVRVSKGVEDYKERDRRHRFLNKIKEVPEDAQEILLLRCLRDRGAKAVYIPRKRNGQQKDFAVVTFESQEELEKASEKPCRYNNTMLRWSKCRSEDTNTKEQRARRIEESKEVGRQSSQRGTNDDGYDSAQEFFAKWEEEFEKGKTERKGKNKTSQPSEDKKGKKNDEVWERIDQHQNILQEILRKLEAISERQVIPAQRS